ncbi:MAG TPA: hypothetical protein PKI15_01745 [Candidatus Cloacimonadota bacterium]|nr:hypothetical protein [Candidatus Cloacimonadota bacterium]
MKIKNTWKHALVGSLVGLAGAGIQSLVNLIPNTVFEIGWFVVAVMLFFAVRYEIWQENNSGMPTDAYIRLKWLDCIVDVVAAVVCCALVLWGLGAL